MGPKLEQQVGAETELDLESEGRKWQIERSLPVLDESAIPIGLLVNPTEVINLFLSKTSYTFIGEKSYITSGMASGAAELHIYPFDMKKSFGVRIRYVEGKIIPEDVYPTHLINQQIISFREEERVEHRLEPVTIYQVGRNARGKDPLFPFIYLHYSPKKDVEEAEKFNPIPKLDELKTEKVA